MDQQTLAAFDWHGLAAHLREAAKLEADFGKLMADLSDDPEGTAQAAMLAVAATLAKADAYDLIAATLLDTARNDSVQD
jgi:hypothetical protein